MNALRPSDNVAGRFGSIYDNEFDRVKNNNAAFQPLKFRLKKLAIEHTSAWPLSTTNSQLPVQMVCS
jgi:hypothetical protein